MESTNSSVNKPNLSQEGEPGVILAACVEIVLCLLGTLGNSLTIAAVCRNKNLQVASNFLLGSLAFADLLVSVILVPMRAAQHMALYLGSDVPSVVVSVAGFVGRVNIIASISSLSAMSIDRYIALSHPMHYLVSIRFAKNKVFTVIALIWALSVLVTSIPKFPGVSDRPFLIFFVVFVLLITLTIAVAYFKIFKIAQKANKRKQSSKTTASQVVRLSLTSTLDRRIFQEIEKRQEKDKGDVGKQERKAAKTIAFVIGAFVILVYPRILLILYHFAARETASSKHARFWSRILLYSNSVVNPALYAWRHNEFKREFKRILLKCWKLCTCIRRRRRLKYLGTNSSKMSTSTMAHNRDWVEREEGV